MKVEIKKIYSLTFVILICLLLLLDPKTAKNGLFSGILLSGRVIIPSLFMFTFIAVFCTKSGVAANFIFLNKISLTLLGLDFYEFYIFVVSLIGGYPVGVKLLNEAVKDENISKSRAEEISYYFICSGPGFCVSVIGESFLKSREIGYILLVSQQLTTIVLCRIFIRKSTENKIYNFKPQKTAESFVKSVSETASTLINISAFVIVFSFFTEYCANYAKYITALSYFPYFLEISNAVTMTKNLYFISFLLGFGGISVIFQLVSISDNFNIRTFKLIVFRVTAGSLSCLLTKLFMMIFKVSYTAISTNQNFSRQDFFNGPSFSVCLFLTITLFMVSIISKKYAGKILEDVI